MIYLEKVTQIILSSFPVFVVINVMEHSCQVNDKEVSIVEVLYHALSNDGSISPDPDQVADIMGAVKAFHHPLGEFKCCLNNLGVLTIAAAKLINSN